MESDLGTVFKLSNCEVMRLDVDDEHFYYGSQDGFNKEYYMSLTHVLDIGAPFPEGLRQYLRMATFEEQKERLEFTGGRGKKLHDALERLMNKEELDLQHDYTSSYEKDAIVTFIRMIRFLDPKKYSTELLVADPTLKVAGTLDFKGFVDEWKLTVLCDPIKYLELDSDGDYMLKEKWLGLPDVQKKRVHIIIDWKFTGRNAYNHKVQVAAYRTMNNKSRKGSPVSRAFTWRYSSRHKFDFDFSEAIHKEGKPYTYHSFKRIYRTTLEYLGQFPDPPVIKRFPDSVRLYDKVKVKEISNV